MFKRIRTLLFGSTWEKRQLKHERFSKRISYKVARKSRQHVVRLNHLTGQFVRELKKHPKNTAGWKTSFKKGDAIWHH